LILAYCCDFEPELKKAFRDSGFEVYEAFLKMYKTV
jgi:hypothetical protein